MDDGKRAELLMEHYKDTFEHILYHWKARNRLFAFILILLAILALDLAQPGSLAQVTNAYIAKTLTADAAHAGGQAAKLPVLDFSAVGSLSWFALLCLVIQYYQRSIHVDRQYKYIASVEQKLSELAGHDFVTREGKAYLSASGAGDANGTGKRPLYLRAVGPLYVYVFPAVLSLFVLGSLYRGGWHPGEVTFWLNVVFGIAIVFYNALYLRWVARRK